MNDDIEAIEETLPKLEACYNGISAPVDDLLNRVDRSTISSEAVENKIKTLQVRGCTYGVFHVFVCGVGICDNLPSILRLEVWTHDCHVLSL